MLGVNTNYQTTVALLLLMMLLFLTGLLAHFVGILYQQVCYYLLIDQPDKANLICPT